MCNTHHNLSLVEQLTDIYLNEETYYKEKMSKEEADKHHEAMLKAGRIITVSDNGYLAGYVEFEIQHGLCFINDLFIRPAYRHKKVIWMMYRRLKEIYKGKVYFGERNKNGLRYPEFQLRSKHGQ